MPAPSVARWRNDVMLAFGLGGVVLATWGPRLGALRADLGVGDSGLGLVLAGVTVGSITGLLASTPLMARLGGRGAIRVSLAVVAAGLLVVATGAALAGSPSVATVGFAVLGFGVGALDVSINVEGSSVERAAGRTLLPLMHASWSAGAVVGAAIGALAAAASVGYLWQFTAEAALLALVAAFGARGVPRTHPHDEPAPDGSERPSPAQRVGAWARGWLDLRLLLIGVVMLGVELGEGTANNWLTLAVHDGHGVRAARAAWFFVAFALGETLARVLGGPLVDRVGRVAAVRVTTALGVVGLVLFIAGTSPPVVLVGTVLWAVGVSMGFPLGMSAAAEGGPGAAARVSVVATIGYVANLAGPPLIGSLSERFGILHALTAVGALMVAGFLLAGAVRSRPARDHGRDVVAPLG